jgi:hypothetical protein
MPTSDGHISTVAYSLEEIGNPLRRMLEVRIYHTEDFSSRHAKSCYHRCGQPPLILATQNPKGVLIGETFSYLRRAVGAVVVDDYQLISNTL